MGDIVLDTETTGLDPEEGHRIIEIGCVHLNDNLIPTGRTLHLYLNPDRAVDAGAQAVHGLSDEFLADKPRFQDIADEFLEFIGDCRLVIHNAGFDMKFINAELVRAGRNPLPMGRAFDTLALTRKKFPGAPASLDALCRRFGIDNSNRSLHGALLDSELLAEVYLHLKGGRQVSLGLDQTGESSKGDPGSNEKSQINRLHRRGAAKRKRARRYFQPTQTEAEHHHKMLEKLKNPIWFAKEE